MQLLVTETDRISSAESPRVCACLAVRAVSRVYLECYYARGQSGVVTPTHYQHMQVGESIDASFAPRVQFLCLFLGD